MLLRLFLISSFIFACASNEKKPEVKQADWVIQSNEISRDFIEVLGEIEPEQASWLGDSRYDGKASVITPDFAQRKIQAFNNFIKKLERIKTNDPNVALDISILKEKTQLDIDMEKAKMDLQMISFMPGTKVIFQSINQLVNPQSPMERKKKAIDRFKIYVNGKDGKPGLLPAFESTVRREISKYKNPIYPSQIEVDKYIAEHDQFLQGVRQLLSQTGEDSWVADYNEFRNQAMQYKIFVMNTLQARARADYRLPPRIYELRLKQYGVEWSPAELRTRARKDFESLYKKFEAKAAQVAKIKGFKTKKPARVIEELKKDKVVDPADAIRAYERASSFLEEIISANQLMTLPNDPLKIRVADEVESAASPVPHLDIPPFLNNTGEVPEFVVPSSPSGQMPFDDFSYAASAPVITAHEGRPGHDLQFRNISYEKMSIIRGRFAMNSVNAEGWALYAEELVYPYLEPDSQLVALQSRLWRIGRMFLDPEAQIGKSDRKDVMDTFVKRLGLSETMAQLEFLRYVERQPGQATSYYYGYLLLKDLKEDMKKANGGEMQERCFHDTVLNLGLMPVKEMRRFKSSFMKCGTRKSAAAH